MTKSDIHLVVLGYGDVGKRVVDTFQENDLNFIVIDSEETVLKEAAFDYIIGNATDEETLKEAGVEKASTIIISLNDDQDIIFSTLVCRSLNPAAVIFTRANSIRSIDNIYKAGADHVASLSIVAGQMLAKLTSTCINNTCENLQEDIFLYEGIEIEKYKVQKGSKLAGKTISQVHLLEEIGCKIIGIGKGEQVHTLLAPELMIEVGDMVAVIGTTRQILEFKEQYIKDRK